MTPNSERTVLPPGWLDELAEFLAIPSVSADRSHAGDVRRAAEWVGDWVRRLGGDAEVREDGRLLAGEIPGPADAPTVLVYGHYDVQPPDPLELWESEPFAAEVRGEWLYARGVADEMTSGPTTKLYDGADCSAIQAAVVGRSRGTASGTRCHSRCGAIHWSSSDASASDANGPK
jgi:hypothetical protein